jgi:hypothetical protein
MFCVDLSVKFPVWLYFTSQTSPFMQALQYRVINIYSDICINDQFCAHEFVVHTAL